MKLESLNIGRNTYSFAHGGLGPNEIGGTIKFTGNGGTVEVRLTQAHIDNILAIVADSMVAHTRELATTLTRDVIEHAGIALPSPVAEFPGGEA